MESGGKGHSRGGGGPLDPVTSSAAERRHDLDWLRASVFLILILYHVGMFFVPWDWHVKNPEPAGAAFQIPMFVVSEWRLWLLFLVSGAAVRFSLRRRTRAGFARERLGRLLVPLLFGMLVVVPPQVYYERLTEGAAYASYLAFLPDMFAGGPYPEGNLSWHHLWFVLYALAFALLALPLLHWLRTEHGRPILERFTAWLEPPGRIFLLALPIVVSEMALRPGWPSTHTFIGDWANVCSYLIVFLYGYVLYAADGPGAAAQRDRRLALVLAILAASILVLARQTGAVPPAGYEAGYLAWTGLRALNTWFWIVAIIGYARRYLNVPSRALRHANEAVYPFYILHQTVIVAIAFHLIDWEASIPVKFTVITAGTLLGTTALYLVIRLHPVSRVLFGMRTRPRVGH